MPNRFLQIVEDITGIPFTQSRGVSDSYRWFAPEVCKGQGVLSASSDIYALGMTILEVNCRMLTFIALANQVCFRTDFHPSTALPKHQTYDGGYKAKDSDGTDGGFPG